jgi:hypothetical protein
MPRCFATLFAGLIWKEAGGEGGIRTLDTGFGPYNGLANSARPLPIAWNQSDTITSDVPSRAESCCSADLYAPEYAPQPAELSQRLVTQQVSVNEPSRSADEANIAPPWDEIGCPEHTSAKRLPAHPVGTQQIQSCNPAEAIHPEERRVMRSPKQLRLPPALVDLGFIAVIDELNDVACLDDKSLLEPILITPNGTILKGFGRWRLALFNDEEDVPCTIFLVEEERAVRVILAEHRPTRGWNDFIRISLALTQEAYFRKKALENMSAGGRNKGATNLSEADRIDVAQEIANLAGTGVGNVRKVRLILANAHPSIITALQKGCLRIHRAWLWCRKLTKSEQRVEFARYLEKRDERRLLRGIATPPVSGLFDQSPVMEAVEQLAAWHNSIHIHHCGREGAE